MRAPPGASAGDGEPHEPRRCPAATAPAPERRRAAGCYDYPTGRYGGGVDRGVRVGGGRMRRGEGGKSTLTQERGQ